MSVIREELGSNTILPAHIYDFVNVNYKEKFCFRHPCQLAHTGGLFGVKGLSQLTFKRCTLGDIVMTCSYKPFNFVVPRNVLLHGNLHLFHFNSLFWFFFSNFFPIF